MRRIILAALLLAVGCGRSPWMDATSPRTIASSLSAMTAGMGDEEKKDFELAWIALVDIDAAGPSGDLYTPKVFRPIHRMNVAEIRARAPDAIERRKKAAGAKAIRDADRPEQSRLRAGQAVRLADGGHNWVTATPLDEFHAKVVPVTTPCEVVEDDGDIASDYRDVRVRFGGESPWEGTIARVHLRPVE